MPLEPHEGSSLSLLWMDEGSASTRRYVELPCWSWGCATSCLPKHPSIKSEHVSRQMGFSDDSPEDCPHHAKEGAAHARSDFNPLKSTSVVDSGKQSSFANSAETTLDGAVELQEKEMEQSVFGLFFSLDPSSVPPSLHLSSSCLTVSHHGDSPLQGRTRLRPGVL
ncbi:uncharacterized protein LOC110016230 isoform X2 [Oryzias latipes]